MPIDKYEHVWQDSVKRLQENLTEMSLSHVDVLSLTYLQRAPPGQRDACHACGFPENPSGPKSCPRPKIMTNGP